MRIIVTIVLFVLILGMNSASADEPTGVWKGRWYSQRTGHSGPMRATITPAGNGQYDARFSGRFAGVIPFAYRTPLVATSSDGITTTLVASKKLGPILGSYQMQAIQVGNQFQAGFTAGKDSGSFRMNRVRFSTR